VRLCANALNRQKIGGLGSGHIKSWADQSSAREEVGVEGGTTLFSMCAVRNPTTSSVEARVRDYVRIYALK